MFIGYFTERPYQDPKSGFFGATGKPIMDLSVSNGSYDSHLGAQLEGSLAELDINPLMVLPVGHGVKAADALAIFRA